MINQPPGYRDFNQISYGNYGDFIINPHDEQDLGHRHFSFDAINDVQKDRFKKLLKLKNVKGRRPLVPLYLLQSI